MRAADLNVQDDGYMNLVAKSSCADFTRRQVGMVREVLTQYGPVNRFWFDGTSSNPCSRHEQAALWDQVYRTIRTVSPPTLITAYRGDVCAAQHGATLYTNDGPPPNTTDTSGCQAPRTDGRGKYFHPLEDHGITIQEVGSAFTHTKTVEPRVPSASTGPSLHGDPPHLLTTTPSADLVVRQGPDGNTDDSPTYWFWHPWACAKNVSGCPWVGHANASRIFDSYVVTVGRGSVLNMNIPPERTGRMNTSVARVMRDAGAAINATFHTSVAAIERPVSGPCTAGLATLHVPPGATFDYVMSAEEMRFGARVANYSVEYQAAGSSVWQMLVPPVPRKAPLDDRPDGHDPRDSHIGRKRIDVPIAHSGGVAKVRLNCIAAFESPVHVKTFSLHRKKAPWVERSP
jgi:alpha-L-fucosidase